MLDRCVCGRVGGVLAQVAVPDEFEVRNVALHASLHRLVRVGRNIPCAISEVPKKKRYRCQCASRARVRSLPDDAQRVDLPRVREAPDDADL